MLCLASVPRAAVATILWSDLGATLVHENGQGTDILGGAVRRDDTAQDVLYFKFHVDPLSDTSTEEYFAAFELFEGANERLAVGNSLKAWAYSAFNTTATGEFNKVFGDIDLRSTRPESSAPGVFLPYELPRKGIESTFVVKVQFVPGKMDEITVWLNPDLSGGASETNQPEALITRFTADASFDQVRLRHSGGGGGWTFSDMAIATSFSDFIAGSGSGNKIIEGSPGSLPLTFRLWQREQGLPQNLIRALTQTRDGYIWVGSDEGVARFDGVRFVPFGLREGMISSRVRALLEDRHQRLWIGTQAGLSCISDSHIFNYTIEDGLPSDSINALAEDSSGRVWVGTDAGLITMTGGKVDTNWTFASIQKHPVTCLFADSNTVWVAATGAGIFQALDGTLQPWAAAVEPLLQDAHSLLVDHSGRVWIGAGDDFLLCRDRNEWRRYRIPRHLARPYITSLTEDRDGTVWAGSVSEGLFQFKNGKLANINAASGLADNFISSLLVDYEHNLWVGTASGLVRVRRANLAVFGPAEGLGYGAVQAVVEPAPGMLWAAKPNDGIYRWNGRVFNRLEAGQNFGGLADVNTVLAARDGTVWAGTMKGIYHFTNPLNPQPIIAKPTVTEESITSLGQETNGTLWAGAVSGKIFKLNEGAWQNEPRLDEVHAINSIAFDALQRMWIGTEGGGLVCADHGTKTRFDKSQGLLSDAVRAVYIDAQQTVWAGTSGGGLAMVRGAKTHSFTTREGLPDNSISQILEDDLHRLWLGGNHGLAAVRKQELDSLVAGALPAVYPQVYGRAEGMPSEECTGGFSPAGLKSQSGQLWFSTLKGLVALVPQPRSSVSVPPAVIVEEVLVDGIPAKSKNIPPGHHRLEFHYTGLSFAAPERVRFRYKLDGIDPDWVEAGTRRSALYANVPLGNYRFHVSACNSDGVWSDSGTGVSFTILHRFWQTWWATALGTLLLVVATVLGARLFERKRNLRRLRQIEQERALERERARIAQDLHDDLGSSLTRISLLGDLTQADKNNPAQVETHARKIRQSAAQTVRALEEIVWALRPGSDTLQSLVEYIAHFANELFENDGTRCRLDLPHDLPNQPLPPEMRHNIFLVVKEALTNALKHAQATEVRVQAKSLGSELELTIEDNGRGFDLSKVNGATHHHGVGNMQRRAEMMGSDLIIESLPGRGTTVKLVVPITQPARA